MTGSVKIKQRTIQQQIQIAIISISIFSMLVLGIGTFMLTTNKIVENY